MPDNGLWLKEEARESVKGLEGERDERYVCTWSSLTSHHQ